MQSPFVIWDAAHVKGAIMLHALKNVQKKFEIIAGKSRSAGFRPDAEFHANPAYPKSLRLPDNLMNLDRLVVVSARLRAFVESKAVPHVEFLPLRVCDHKGRELSREYSILSPLNHPECFNRSESVFIGSELTPVNEVQKLVIDAAKVEPERQVFRTSDFVDCVLVRREFANAIDAAGFTGIQWIEVDTFKS